jgi:hypothetical protein
MHPEDRLSDDDHIARLLAELPRSAPVAPGETDRAVQRLRAEGMLRARRQRSIAWFPAAAAAAVLIFAGGVYVGRQVEKRHSLEALVARQDATLADRVVLLQRAQTTYVRAAHAYTELAAGKPIVWF